MVLSPPSPPLLPNLSVRTRRGFLLIGETALLLTPACGAGVPFASRGRPRLLLGVTAAVSSSSPVSLSGIVVVVVAWSALRRTVEGDWTGDLNSFLLVPLGVEAMVSLARRPRRRGPPSGPGPGPVTAAATLDHAVAG